jgi:hypothetical protein
MSILVVGDTIDLTENEKILTHLVVSIDTEKCFLAVTISKQRKTLPLSDNRKPSLWEKLTGKTNGKWLVTDVKGVSVEAGKLIEFNDNGSWRQCVIVSVSSDSVVITPLMIPRVWRTVDFTDTNWLKIEDAS